MRPEALTEAVMDRPPIVSELVKLVSTGKGKSRLKASTRMDTLRSEDVAGAQAVVHAHDSVLDDGRGRGEGHGQQRGSGGRGRAEDVGQAPRAVQAARDGDLGRLEIRTLPLAWLSFNFYEKQFLRLKRRFEYGRVQRSTALVQNKGPEVRT